MEMNSVPSEQSPASIESSPDPSLWGALASSLRTRAQIPPPKRADRNQDLPLSFAQQRLWFLQQADPENVTYNQPFAWRLTGPLNASALERSFNALVQRHESFRTNFVAKDSAPAQVIAPHRPVKLAQTDLASIPANERDAALECELKTRIQTPFNLAGDSLLRPYLFRLQDQEHVLLIVMHHIVCDAASLAVIFRELQLFYRQFILGTVPGLPELPIQYADFAVWQRRWLTEDVLEQQLSYWRKHLGGALPALELPTDHARPAKQSFRGAWHRFAFSPELTQAIRDFRRRENVTVFNCLLAGFKALLFRYTQQEEVLVGSPTANRNATELQPLVGFFVNTIVLRTALTGEMTFRELIDQVRKVSLEAYANQDVPFERLVEELKPGRTLSHSPLFQVMFSFQSLPRRGLELPDLQVQMMHLDPGVAKFDLTLDLNETPQGIAGFIEYSTDLFDRTTIQRMARHLETLIAGAMANPDQPLARLPLLLEEERSLLLSNWNQPQQVYSRETPVHELFRQRAAAAPQSPAVLYHERELTYGELDRRSDLLAHYLRGLGVGPETMVGLCVERSFDLIVSLFGILKAGGAFVPLDPEYPEERLRFMIADSGISLILTQKKLAGMLPHDQAKLVRVDELLSCFVNPPQWKKETVKTSPSNLAYVIYTSGSTGTPKGVLVEHGALAEHCLECQTHYHYTAADRLVQFASPSFDVAIEQIFPPLIAGAQLILRDPVLWTPAEFHEKLATLGITIINLPTAYWHQLAQEWARQPKPVSTHQARMAVIGGEEMHPQSLQLWQQTPFNEVPLFNEYGPTENIVTSTWFQVPPTRPDHPPLRRVPIGRPRGNRLHYVLDRCGQPVPIGVAGELYIGGTVIARGYHNRPDLTQQRFVPDPFSSQPNARMYRTGDLVRYRPDGNLEYLGRIDQQIKLRGFRIELGEIESVLRQHPRLRDPVVIVTNEPNKRLIAFYVAAESAELSHDELSQFLNERLPDYMIPSAFVAIKELPLTGNGKIDRSALPIPEERPKSADHVEPRTPAEAETARIWREVLLLKEVSVLDNFFELGGHSLLATQVISRLKPHFPEATLQDLFEWPTVAGLTACLEKRKSSPQPTGPRLVARSRRPRPSEQPGAGASL